jgi:hypothetical protein
VCALPGRVCDLPTVGDKTVEAATEAELGFDRVMGEIVQREERSAIVILSLPGRGAVRASASKKSPAIFSFGKLESQGAAVYKPPKS